MVNSFASPSKVFLGQQKVYDGSNEITAMLLFKLIDNEVF